MTKSDPQNTASANLRPGDRLIELLSPIVEGLGYEIVHLECQLARQKTLRLFIDAKGSQGVGIEDCVKVARALDEPLDQMPELDAVFKGAYELEVSSPGIDRPLRQPKDYEKFQGQEARIHVYRPLTAEEIGNAKYLEKNPRQKNFLGVLKGFRNDRVLLAVGTGSKAGLPELDVEIPLSLISKANLEPKIDPNAREREKA
jgi:ribosome maturation factor RimP